MRTALTKMTTSEVLAPGCCAVRQQRSRSPLAGCLAWPGQQVCWLQPTFAALFRSSRAVWRLRRQQQRRHASTYQQLQIGSQTQRRSARPPSSTGHPSLPKLRSDPFMTRLYRTLVSRTVLHAFFGLLLSCSPFAPCPLPPWLLAAAVQPGALAPVFASSLQSTPALHEHILCWVVCRPVCASAAGRTARLPPCFLRLRFWIALFYVS